MNTGRRNARIRVLLLVALVIAASLGGAPAAAHAPAETATVVGAPAVEIRACPKADCPVRTEAPLGAAVDVRGEPIDGFTPVAFGAAVGFAPTIFLAADSAAPPVFAKGAPGCKRVALIFNIGVGSPPATTILDALETENVPATMFVMGWWAAEHPPILQRMAAAGYPIASHGNQPTELTGQSADAVADDLREAAAEIEHATGQPPAPYFTPYAAASDDRVRAVVAAQGVLPIAWEVPADDYSADATEQSVYDRVMTNVYDGAIVELHLDGPASATSTGRALPRIVAELREQGYRFVTIPEMLEPC